MSQNITTTSIVCKSTEQVSGDLNGETILMHMIEGNYFGLGDVGSTIWSMLDEPIQVSDLCKKLVAQYKVDLETCSNDVLRFLAQLKDAELLECNNIST